MRIRHAITYLSLSALLGAAVPACGTNEGGKPIVPIDAPDAQMGDPSTKEARILDPTLLGHFYLATHVVRNRVVSADGKQVYEALEVTIPITTAAGYEEIPPLSSLVGIDVAGFDQGKSGIVLVTPQAFTQYLFGNDPTSPSPQKLADGNTLLSRLQSAYLQAGIEALNGTNDLTGQLRSADHLAAVYRVLAETRSRGLTYDPSSPVIAGRTPKGTSFFGYPVRNDGANPAIFFSFAGASPLPQPPAGARYGKYSPLPGPQMDGAVRGLVGFINTGF